MKCNYQSIAELFRTGKYAEVVAMSDSIFKNQSSLGYEFFNVLEMLATCAFHMNVTDVMKKCLTLLRNEFGESSSRLQTLLTMTMETVTVDKKNPEAKKYKRVVADHRANGDLVRAVDVLNEYLDVCPTDADAWSEMQNLQLAAANVSRAAFCAEELILSDPQNFNAFVQRGHGALSLKDFEVAYVNFCRALELRPDNLLGLWGLFKTLCEWGEEGSTNAALTLETRKKLLSLSRQKLADQYTATTENSLNRAAIKYLVE